MAEPSAYELKRAEQIRQNNAHLAMLGIIEDVEALRGKPKPKPKPKPKQPKPQQDGPARRSSRLDGLPAELEMDADNGGAAVEQSWSAPVKADRNPFGCWWTACRENPEGVM